MARLGPFEFQRGYQLNFKFSFGFFPSTLLAGLLFCVALPGFAQSTAFLDGALTEDSLTFNNPGGQGAGNQHYCVQAFTVDAAGAYTFEMSSPNTTGTPSDALDTFLRLYQTSFDPSNPGGAIATNDDFTGTLTVLPGPYAGVITSTATGFQGDQPSSRLLNVSLSDGTQYFLVHTTWPSSGNTQVGTAGQPVGQFYTGIAGPGAITLGTGDCSVPQIDADLALSMVVTPASVQAGESISLEATIANDGPAAAEAVSLEVSLPAGVTFVSGGLDQGAGTWSCAEAAGLVTCELTADTLPVDPQAAVLLIELDVALAAAPGNYSLDGEVISENDTDPDLGNNTASVSFELLPFAVTASTAVGQGGITPASQSVASGADASFTLSPATGWSVDSVIGDTCNPINTAGDQWQAANITADCAVEASFVINTYMVTATVGSGEGSISPAGQAVDHGDEAVFMVTPDLGWSVTTVTGDTCTPVFDSGDQWVAANITQACTVTANFAQDTFTVTASVSSGQGNITPATQNVVFDETASFTVTPDTGWSVDSVVGDTCSPVEAAGSSWQAPGIRADCAVEASFLINSYSLGGSVSGLEGTGLVLSLDGEELLSIADNGPFTFAAELDHGTAWNVSVDTQPSGPMQTCTVSNGSSGGIVGDVSNIEVACSTDTFSIGGSVSGLVAAGLQLALNGDQALSVAAGAVSFEFADPLADGSNYDVTVANQPAGQWCEVSNGQGQLDGASVNDVLVSCGDVGINFSLNEIDFGAETVGSSSSIVLTISNPGSTPLSIDGITPPGSPFEIIASGCSPLPVTLEAGESCSLEVRFNNVEPGLQTDELTVSSNANNSPHTIPIRGNGIVAIPVPILSPIGLLLLTLIMLIFGYRSSQRRQRD